MAGKFALIIGNSQYQDPNLTRLKAPEADVEELSALLRDPSIGAFDEVVTLANELSAPIRRTIGQFFAQKTADDLLLLYFSGHGVLDESGELFLATKDTERDLISATAIPAAYITGQMDRSRSKRQVLILDCCHSGAFARGSKGAVGASVGTATAFQGTGYGRVVLTATDATQFAWEGDQVIGTAENSLFTHYMIEGLRTGEADTDGDGRISIENLYDYVYEQVVRRTPKQTPGKWSYKQQGEIVIANNPKPVTKPAELPRELREAIDDARPWVREGAVHELERLLKGRHPGLALAALEALKQLADDDSRRVANAATQLLNAYEEAKRLQEQARVELERQAREQAEAERLAREKVEAGRIARERAEAERVAREKAEQERVAKEQAEAERIARERAEQERVVKEQAEAERLAREKAEAERIALERAEQERTAKAKAKAERLAREKAEAERVALERAEQDRVAKEKAEAERLAREKAEQARVVKERAERLAPVPVTAWGKIVAAVLPVLSVREIAIIVVFAALAILMGESRFTFFSVPVLAASIAGVLEGPLVGALIGGIYGLSVFLPQYPYANPAAAILPPLLIGITAYFTYARLRGRNEYVALAAAGVVGSVTFTVLTSPQSSLQSMIFQPIMSAVTLVMVVTTWKGIERGRSARAQAAAVPATAPGLSVLSVREIVITVGLAALAILMGFARLGFSPVLAAMIGGILEGPLVGALVGGIYGLSVFLPQYPYANPASAILPPLLAGIAAYFTYARLRGRNEVVALAAAGVVGSIVDTVLVLGLMMLFGNFPLAALPSTIQPTTTGVIMSAVTLVMVVTTWKGIERGRIARAQAAAVPATAPGLPVLSVRKIVITVGLAALAILVGFARLGTTPPSSFASQATIVHVPAIIGGILEGPLVGALVGGIYGLFLFLPEYRYANPLIPILPPLLVGVAAYFTYARLRGRNEIVALAAAGVVGSVVDRALWFGLSALFTPIQLGAGLVVGSQPFVQLALVDPIITVVVVTAWKWIESRATRSNPP